MFSRWEPPKGYDIQGFWNFADGTGGVSVVDVDSPETIAKAIFPFTPYLRISVRPILPIQDAGRPHHRRHRVPQRLTALI